MAKASTICLVKLGSFAVPITRYQDGRYYAAVNLGTSRRKVTSRDLDFVKSEVERLLVQVVNGETEAAQLTASEARIYLSARALLASTGLSVDAVARDFMTAHKATGGVPLSELARFYMGRRPEERITAPGTEGIVAELMQDLRDHQRSDVYVDRLKRDLERFAKSYPELPPLTQRDLLDWLREQKMRNGEPIGPRRRDNLRDALVLLFRFARKRFYLPQDRITEAEHIERLKPGTDVGTYTPKEIALLLEHASKRWRPFFVIAAFAGLRTSEIFRLDWNAVKFDLGVIAIHRKVARKVRTSRQVPIVENLQLWLEEYRDHHGPLYLPAAYTKKQWKDLENAYGNELERLRGKTGIQTHTNGFRHSFGSYRLAVVKSYDQVAIEMGNSPQKVRENYNDPKPEAEAKLYFSIQPADTIHNVLPLGLQFR